MGFDRRMRMRLFALRTIDDRGNAESAFFGGKTFRSPAIDDRGNRATKIGGNPCDRARSPNDFKAVFFGHAVELFQQLGLVRDTAVIKIFPEADRSEEQ